MYEKKVKNTNSRVSRNTTIKRNTFQIKKIDSPEQVINLLQKYNDSNYFLLKFYFNKLSNINSRDKKLLILYKNIITEKLVFLDSFFIVLENVIDEIIKNEINNTAEIKTINRILKLKDKEAVSNILKDSIIHFSKDIYNSEITHPKELKKWEIIKTHILSIIKTEKDREKENYQTMINIENSNSPKQLYNTIRNSIVLGRRNTPRHETKIICYKVFYGTNRQEIFNSDKKFVGFSNKITDVISYGECDILIPKGHQFGETKMSLKNKLLKMIVLNFKDNESLKIDYLEKYANEEIFWEQTNEMYRESNEKEALIFIHGYNTSFNDAAIRTAQIGYDLKVKGLSAFFSWPSKGNLKNYRSDGEIIQESEIAMHSFIKNFIEKSGATKVHLIAHSMGNRGFFRTLEKLRNDNVKFGQIILAAPDMDSRLFKNSAKLYEELSERTTLYVSSQDLPVMYSKFLHENDRLGFAPPITIVDNIDTILVNQKFVNYLINFGHGYFAEAKELLRDIHDLITHNQEPSNRLNLKCMVNNEGKYWELKE